MAIKGMPTSVVVDFTNVREGSGYTQTHQEPGDYRGKVASVEYGESKENKTPMLTYALADAERPSAKYRYNCPLTEKSLWKLRNLLTACGVAVPAKKVNIASVAEKIVGREVGMSLDDDEYNGNLRSQVTGVFPASDLPVEETSPSDARSSRSDNKTAKNADEGDDTVDADPADDGGDEEEALEELDLDDL